MTNDRRYYPLHCWLLGSADHGNLGDHQINVSIGEFLRSLMPDIVIHEVPVRSYYEQKKYLIDAVLPDDVLVILGGGDVGTLWPNAEKLRADAFQTWPDNPKIIFPQSVFFTPDPEGAHALEESSRVYQTDRCLLALRDAVSYSTAKEHFGCGLFLTPDIVMYSKIESPLSERSGCLLLLRNDKERSMGDKDRSMLEETVKERFTEIILSDTVRARVGKEDRETALSELYSQICSSSLVITDRLHGMLLAAVTGTPCVFFPNSSHKIRASVPWVEDLPYIRFAERAEDLGAAIDELDLTKNYTYPLKEKRALFSEFSSAVKKMLDASRKAVREENPKVSVVIPVYNVEAYLDECLSSVLHQTLREIEIICVNDGSTDKSLDILNRYAAENPRMVIISQENKGLSAARNVGMDRARGRYLYFLDSDDYIEPQMLELLYGKMEEMQLDMLFFNVRPFSDGNQFDERIKIIDDFYKRRTGHPGIYSGNEMLKRFLDQKTYGTQAWAYILRTEFIKINSLRFIEGIYHEDNPFTLSCLALAKRTGHISEAFYNHRIRENSIATMKKSFKHAYGYFAGAKALSRFLQGIDPEGVFTELYLYRISDIITNAVKSFEQLPKEEQEKYKLLPRDDAALFYLLIAGPAQTAARLSKINQDLAKQKANYRELAKEKAKYREMAAPFTGRLDILLKGEHNDRSIELTTISDKNAIVTRPAWLQELGTGIMIESAARDCDLTILFVHGGEVKMWLRGQDIRDENDSRIPVWIDASSFVVNGEKQIHKVTPVWHDRPIVRKMKVMAGDEIHIRLGWKIHQGDRGLRIRKLLRKTD